MQPCVYMMASKRRGTIYIGVTSDLASRDWEHWSRANPKSFTARTNARYLVWYEEHEIMTDAIQREKSLKRWYRDWKIELIEKTNPQWHPINPDTGEFMYDGDWS
ncbi:GIY-YIG nuclease family protein [Robiginitomaculum antarcticum]|uniref:GIY-YIG nuclease family protein n=1 Tax=Robiginitomaculum antarcticum TaxID=437507 RepID=UPI0004761995|nr:GIY-YIG nuclease family protein [Robiginitomaculum antarcticum]